MNKVLLSCLALLPFMASAQIDTLRLTLDDCITIARRQSIDATVALGELRSAYWQWRSYKADLLPEVSLSGTLPSWNKRYNSYQQADGSLSFVRNNYLGLADSPRLVAAAFLGPIPNGMEVDHINEDHKDNRVSNLQFLSRFDNASRSTRGVFRKESNAMENNPRTKRVVGIKDGIVVEVVPCAKYLSKRYGINYSTLRGRLQRGGITINETLFRYETTP